MSGLKSYYFLVELYYRGRLQFVVEKECLASVIVFYNRLSESNCQTSESGTIRIIHKYVSDDSSTRVIDHNHYDHAKYEAVKLALMKS